MKLEDLEVGKTYVMLKDESIFIKKGNMVEFLGENMLGEWSVLISDLGEKIEGNGKWYVPSSNLGEVEEVIAMPTETHNDKYEQHRQLCEKIHETYVAKNKDYGDSFTRTRKEAKYPELVIVTRLSDKFYRLKTLLEGAEQQVKDESINDTLLDLANYCLMELLERQNGKEVNI